MAKIAVYDMNREQVAERELVDAVFNTDVKEYLLHDMVRYQLAARRQGTAKVKGRSEVRGGGKKPYRQKGTGNARQGTVTAPNHVGGGVVFGPKPRDYRFKLNRKVKQSALRSALSCRFQGESMTVVKALDLDKISTKGFAEVLDRFALKKALIVIDGENTNLELSARNLPFVKVMRAEGVNVYDILKYPSLVLTEAAVDRIEGVLAK
ncbi:MAG: 50S ribosomal protein L4 [Desulfuromonadales bacterium]|jgi:large subunit ribosomal protein L4